jgi:hypothetical protein
MGLRLSSPPDFCLGQQQLTVRSLTNLFQSPMVILKILSLPHQPMLEVSPPSSPKSVFTEGLLLWLMLIAPPRCWIRAMLCCRSSCCCRLCLFFFLVAISGSESRKRIGLLKGERIKDGFGWISFFPTINTWMNPKGVWRPWIREEKTV